MRLSGSSWEDRAMQDLVKEHNVRFQAVHPSRWFQAS